MKVELVAKTVGVGKYEELSSEEIVAAIARHGVIKEDGGKLVRYLMDNSHWSPLEFINFTFEIETSRAIGRQILRHRSMSGVQEWSQRYSNRVQFESVELRKEHPTNRQSSTEIFDPTINANGLVKLSTLIKEHVEYSSKLYDICLKNGVAKECARMILPECTTTTMNFNGTLRTWLSFLNVRCDSASQKEVQEIATLIGKELEKEMPNVFSMVNWHNGMFM